MVRGGHGSRRVAASYFLIHTIQHRGLTNRRKVLRPKNVYCELNRYVFFLAFIILFTLESNVAVHIHVPLSVMDCY